jgi:hypothetical protein
LGSYVFVHAKEGGTRIRLMQATYRNAATKVVTQHGDRKEFEITVGVHQGSALSPFLFISVMDTLLEDVRTDTP